MKKLWYSKKGNQYIHDDWKPFSMFDDLQEVDWAVPWLGYHPADVGRSVPDVGRPVPDGGVTGDDL